MGEALEGGRIERLRRILLIAASCLVPVVAVASPAGADPGGARPGPPRRASQVISAASAHTCAVLDGGSVKCWGAGSFGRLGNEATTNIGDGVGPSVLDSQPVGLGAGRSAVAVSAGEFHSCALLAGGQVKCWGDGGRGRLGLDAEVNVGDGVGPSVAASGTVNLGAGRTATMVAAGGAHTCASVEPRDDGEISGTDRPRARHCCSAPMAIMSLSAKIASGGVQRQDAGGCRRR